MLHKYGVRVIFWNFYVFHFIYFRGVQNRAICTFACWIGDNDGQRGSLSSHI